MNTCQPRTDDMSFILSQVLQAPSQLQALPGFTDIDIDLMQQVLDEAGKFVGEVVAPEDGGQGLPTVLEAMLYEMPSTANHGWTMAATRLLPS